MGNTAADQPRPLASSPRIQAVAVMIAHLSVRLKPTSPYCRAKATTSAPSSSAFVEARALGGFEVVEEAGKIPGSPIFLASATISAPSSSRPLILQAH